MTKLGGCDMLLGMDWIDLYALIELYTRHPSISFHNEGKKVTLKKHICQGEIERG